MKNFLPILLALLLPVVCRAGGWPTYSASEAKDHVGEDAVVLGKVEQVSQSAKAVFVNFGGKFPAHVFTAVSFNLPYSALSKFEGKTVSVFGTIKDYKGKPEIVLHDILQISLYEKP